MGEGGLSRKALFTSPPPATPDAAKPSVPAQPPSRTRPLMGSAGLIPDAQPVGAVGKSLSEMSDRAKRAEEIERKLTTGQVIVDLDPDLIDPSFVSDRMEIAPEALQSLREKIEAHGQLNPIMVRPHPDAPGRYQVAFGHRRLRAVKEIGRQVRAVVREMTDEELVIAQGQENHEREDLSYIEKCVFASRLEQRGFSRATIMSALSVYKSDLSNMLSVAKIPEGIVEAIGPAPGTGRRGWIELASLVDDHTVAINRAIQNADFATMDSDSRFKAVLTATKAAPDKASTEVWMSKGKPLAKVTFGGNKVALSIDRKKSPEFADFVLTRLRDLYQEFEATRS